MKPYTPLKPQIRYEAHEDSLIIKLRKHPVLYRDYLAPSTLDRLNSTLQRPDISDDFRDQIQGILAKYPKNDAPRDFRQLLPRRPSPGLPHRGQAP